ncbi:MAG: hypothetical protein ACK2UW_16010 [Anaerolineales bacterium]|jgi:hypothetical protein
MTEVVSLENLRLAEYRQRLAADLLRRAVFAQSDPHANPELLEELLAAEQALSASELALTEALTQDPSSGRLLDNTANNNLPGVATTGLEVTAFQRLAAIPTAIVHLFDPQTHPLVTIQLCNTDEQRTRRLRIYTYLEGYSAQAVDTVELAPGQELTIDQLPVLYPSQIQGVTELTRASLNVLIEDLQDGVQMHLSRPLWLLSRESAPLAVRDPHTGRWNDLTIYFGAYVTPNTSAVMRFMRLAAEHHPKRRLVGYQGDPGVVAVQVRAAFDALKTESRIAYINAVLEFTPEQGFATQRVRLPRESLADRQANSIDGVVLFASLLEAMSLSPAITVVPGHALVGWETWPDSGEWHYLETTMIASHTFEEACASAEQTAARYQELADVSGQPHYFVRHSLPELRTQRGISPLE